MRIAFVGSEGVPYHAAFAKITEEIGCRLAAAGHQVIVYGRRRYVPDGSPYRGMLRVPLPSWNTKHLDTPTFTLLSVLHVLRRAEVDIAHIHGIGPAIWALLPRMRRVKVVVQVHSLDWQRAKWGPLARLYLRLSERAAVRWSNAAIAVSPVIKDYLEGRYGGSVYYVPNGVEIQQAPLARHLHEVGLEPGKYLLFMGRLVPEKGCHHLIEAVRRIRPALPLVMAGGESHSEEYARALRQMADSQVRFLGYVTGRLKEELLGNAYIYVQPSDLEGMSLALLEAMAYGRCILASDIAENMVVVRDSAATFRAGDVEDLAHQLANLLGQPQLVRELGERAEVLAASHYGWDTVTRQVEDIYRRLVQPEQALEATSKESQLP